MNTQKSNQNIVSQDVIKQIIDKIEKGEKLKPENIVYNRYPKTVEEARKRLAQSTFWKNQPVPKLVEPIVRDGPITALNTSLIALEPISLSPQYEWVEFDINNTTHSASIAKFLQTHYIEDPESKFKLHYTADFLKWTLHDAICLGVQSVDKKILVGFITASIHNFRVNAKTMDMAEINFLCVHPKLRNKGLTQTLITEITRRVNLKDVAQAFFTSDRYLPKPFTTVDYHHRAINFEKLLEVKFCQIDEKLQKDTTQIKNYHIIHEQPDEKYTELLDEKYLEESCDLLNEYLEKYNFYQIFTQEQFKHLFFNNPFVKTYVIIDKEADSVIDFVSYYLLPSRILNPDSTHKFINAGYLFYYTSHQTTSYNLIKNAIIFAANNGCDVFNAINTMENAKVLTELKFIVGTGQLNYYFYNYKSVDLIVQQIGKLTV